MKTKLLNRLQSNRWKYSLWGVVLIFIIYTTFGFLGLPLITRHLLITQAEEYLHRTATVENIQFNPYTFSLTVTEFKLHEPEGSQVFISFEKLSLNFELSSFFKMAAIVKKFELISLFVNIIREDDQRYNFSDLIADKPSDSLEAPPSIFLFSFNNIQIINGNAKFEDRPHAKFHILEDLKLTSPFLSNFEAEKDTYVIPSLSFKINQTLLTLQGKSEPFSSSKETYLELQLEDLDIPYYMAYAPVDLPLEVVSGKISTKVNLSYSQTKNGKQDLNLEGEVLLQQLEIVNQKQESLLQLPEAKFTIFPSQLLTPQVHIANISLQSLKINLWRDTSGVLNFLSLFPVSKENDAPTQGLKKQEPSSFSFLLDHLEMKSGNLSFSDKASSIPFDTELNNIDLTIDDFSIPQKKKTKVALSTQTESQEKLGMNGELSWMPLTWKGTIEVSGLDLPKYAPYYQDFVLFEIESGKLNFHSNLLYTQEQDNPQIQLSHLSTALQNIKIIDPVSGNRLLQLPLFNIQDSEFDWSQKTIKFGKLDTSDGQISLVRFKDNSFNLQHFARISPQTTKPPEGLSDSTESTSSQWQIALQEGRLENYVIDFEDLSLANPAKLRIENLTLAMEEFSMQEHHKNQINLALTLNKGQLQLNGLFSTSPLFADLQLNLNKISFAEAQSYIPENINIILTSGQLTTSGNVLLTMKEDQPQVTYQGNLSIDHLAILDQFDQKDFLKWDNLEFSKLNVGYNPLYVNIEEIRLSDFYFPLILNADGAFNVAAVFGGKSASADNDEEWFNLSQQKALPEPKPPIQVNVQKVSLEKGHIRFIDKKIQPNYFVSLNELESNILGLTEIHDKPAKVSLKGKLNHQTPLQIFGEIYPLTENFFLDLELQSSDIDMSSFSMYSGHYLGYKIPKGQLSLNLKYKVANNKIHGENKILFDQLTLGQEVESSSAISLPLRLVLAILEDRNGRIHLDIPVAGNLDNPEFSLGKTIFQALTNMIEKTATAPLTLLGSLFGEEEDLKYVDFDHGQVELNEEEMKKLKVMVKILYERPQLHLEVEGSFDAQKDARALQQAMFEKRLKLEKFRALQKKGESGINLNTLTLSAQERDTYLKGAYLNELQSLPGNKRPLKKELSLKEMKDWLWKRLEVNLEDLRELAIQRALNVRNHLIEKENISGKRVFLTESEKPQTSKKSVSHVELRLK